MIVVEQPQYMNRENPGKESFFDGKAPATFAEEGEFIKARTGEAPIPAQSPAATPPAEGYPTRQTIQPQNNAVSAYDRVRQVMATSIPKPTYDPNRPEEMKRLARASALSKGFNLIGDIVGVSQKANVQRRQPNNNELAYLDNTYKYLDDYSRRLDDWNYKDFVNRLRGAELGVQQENIAADNARRDKAETAQEARWKAEMEQRSELSKQEFENRKTLEGIQARNALDLEELRSKGNLKEIYARNYKNGTGDNDNIRIKTRSGKTYELTIEDASLARDMAIQNQSELAKIRPELFEAEVDEVFQKPTGKYVINKKATDEDLIRAMLELQEQQQSKPAVNKNGFEAYYGKGKTPETAQQKQEKEYSTGGYY